MGLIIVKKEGTTVDMINKKMYKGTKGKLKNKWYVTYNSKKYIIKFYGKSVPSIHI